MRVCAHARARTPYNTCYRFNLRKGSVGKLFEVELRFLACVPALLPFIDAGGGDRGQTHAVTKEQDDVFGHLVVTTQPQRLV